MYRDLDPKMEESSSMAMAIENVKIKMDFLRIRYLRCLSVSKEAHSSHPLLLKSARIPISLKETLNRQETRPRLESPSTVEQGEKQLPEKRKLLLVLMLCTHWS